jgi:hypothetical protein
MGPPLRRSWPSPSWPTSVGLLASLDAHTATRGNAQSPLLQRHVPRQFVLPRAELAGLATAFEVKEGQTVRRLKFNVCSNPASLRAPTDRRAAADRSWNSRQPEPWSGPALPESSA